MTDEVWALSEVWILQSQPETEGLNKAQNKLRKDNFLNVLKAKVSGSGTNRAYLISTYCLLYTSPSPRDTQ